MEDKKNIVKVYTTASGAELSISAPATKQVISATNNKAQQYAEMAKKYSEEAKSYRDNAKFYVDQNSDVTYEYIDTLKLEIEQKISLKQDSGDYVLKEELPQKISYFENDLDYISREECKDVIEESALPPIEGNEGKFLVNDGESVKWTGVNGFNLFDTKLSDKILSYKESKGWALQGTFVYKEAIAGSRYGYPDFYNKCLEEKQQSDTIEVTLGNSTITMYVNSNGHKFYDIADKEFVDDWFNTHGFAWFYGVDTENECIFLPRNNWFEQSTVLELEVGQGIEAGLPDHTHEVWGTTGNNVSGAYSSGTIAVKKYNETTPASESNSIYGKSDTVQPNAVKKLLYICVGNTTSYECVSEIVNQGLEILEQVNQGLTTRVDLDISNLSSDGKKNILSYGMPDYSAGINITSSLHTNKSYTAPQKGVLFNAMIATNNTDIKINGNSIGIRKYSSYGNWIPTPYYLDAGDIFSVSGWIDSNGGAYFFPLKGVN